MLQGLTDCREDSPPQSHRGHGDHTQPQGNANYRKRCHRDVIPAKAGIQASHRKGRRGAQGSSTRNQQPSARSSTRMDADERGFGACHSCESRNPLFPLTQRAPTPQRLLLATGFPPPTDYRLPITAHQPTTTNTPVSLGTQISLWHDETYGSSPAFESITCPRKSTGPRCGSPGQSHWCSTGTYVPKRAAEQKCLGTGLDLSGRVIGRSSWNTVFPGRQLQHIPLRGTRPFGEGAEKCVPQLLVCRLYRFRFWGP
jgi:hypothetical protein